VEELEPIPTACDTASAISEIKDRTLSVFPNPVDEVLYVQSTSKALGELVLVDFLGRELWRNVIDEKDYSLPTKHLQDGIYFLISSENGIQKVICKH